jgi:tRNA pseudouridine38-40 synthase
LGAPFRGFALQRGQVTVASALSGALERVLRRPVRLTCAGRTDAGVHAWGQVVSLDVAASADLERLQRSVNRMLAPSVLVREVEWAAPGFDARRWALSRRYRYTLVCTKWLAPFDAGRVWHVPAALDLLGMQAAGDVFLGEHDFTSFCHKPPGTSAVRRVLRAEWSDLGDGRLLFDIEASSFCHQMVRSLVGTLVDVGMHRRRAGDLTSVLAAKDRALAGPLAPPQGLCLWEVSYPASSLAVQPTSLAGQPTSLAGQPTSSAPQRAS